MKEKHLKFLLQFHKKSRHLYTLRDGRVEQNREFKGLIIWAVILF
tara:strand:- start:313 stop:447 length:135 start_codon:yes stop_codon:yes gene_type:complete